MNNPEKTQPAGARVEPRVIPPHGGYRNLKSYQMAEIIHDATVVFANRFVDRFSRTRDQMVQAARSGKQNIAEGSQVSGTSKASEIKLVGVARASLEELLVDAQDYLRQHALALWGKDDPKAKAVRAIGQERDRSYGSYKTYFEGGTAEAAANALVCLVHQANYLLDQQLHALEREVVEKGGFNERLYMARVNYRQVNRSK